MMYRYLLSLSLVAVLAASASAARVGFMGTFTQETAGTSSGFLGAGPYPVAFGELPRKFVFTEGASAGVLTNSGVDLKIGASQVWVQSGTASLVENGLNDTATFVLQVSTTAPAGPVDGFVQMQFSGDLISSNIINQATFNELMGYPTLPPANSPSTAITYTDLSNGLHSYIGTVLAVPEPGSFACLAAIGCVGLLRRRRQS